VPHALALHEFTIKREKRKKRERTRVFQRRERRK